MHIEWDGDIDNLFIYEYILEDIFYYISMYNNYIMKEKCIKTNKNEVFISSDLIDRLDHIIILLENASNQPKFSKKIVKKSCCTKNDK